MFSPKAAHCKGQTLALTAPFRKKLEESGIVKQKRHLLNADAFYKLTVIVYYAITTFTAFGPLRPSSMS